MLRSMTANPLSSKPGLDRAYRGASPSIQAEGILRDRRTDRSGLHLFQARHLSACLSKERNSRRFPMAYGTISRPKTFSPKGAGVPVAVLPFLDLSGGRLSRLCAQGLTDEIVHVLAATDGIRVVASASIAQLNEDAPDVPSLAQRLRVTTSLKERSAKKEIDSESP